MAILGGYGAVDGSANLSGDASGGRDFLDVSQTITTAGDVETFDIYLYAAQPSGEELKLKIWRLNGSNYDFIGESQAFSSLSIGSNTGLSLTTPIAVQVGDIIGIHLSNNGDGYNHRVDVDSNTSNDVVYKAGDSTTSQATSSYTTLSNYSLCAEVHGTAAGSGTTVNATSASIDVSTFAATVTVGNDTNVNATLASIDVTAYAATVTVNTPTNVNATLASIDVSANAATVTQVYGIVTEPLKNNTGTVLASTGSIIANVYNLSTGALVVRKTGLTSDANGVIQFTDASLSASTTYLVLITVGSSDGVARIATGA